MLKYRLFYHGFGARQSCHRTYHQGRTKFILGSFLDGSGSILGFILDSFSGPAPAWKVMGRLENDRLSQ